jgi:alpha-L-fucosidase
VNKEVQKDLARPFPPEAVGKKPVITCGGKAVKEAIGDAIRNAGMRFGVALEMWKKESPRDTGEDVPERQMDRPAQTPEEQKTELRGQIAMVGRAKQMTIEQIATYFHEWSYGKYDITTANERVLGEFLTVLRDGKS